MTFFPFILLKKFNFILKKIDGQTGSGKSYSMASTMIVLIYRG